MIEEDDLWTSRDRVLLDENVAGMRVAMNVAELEDHVRVHLSNTLGHKLGIDALGDHWRQLYKDRFLQENQFSETIFKRILLPGDLFSH